MTNSLRDGLGYEEIGQAGSQVSNIWVTGSVYSESNISGANIYGTTAVQGVNVIGTTHVSGLNVWGTGSIQAPKIVGTTHISGLNFYGTTLVQGGNLQANASGTIPRAVVNDVVLTTGSPYGRGTILQMPARSDITGGMWVLGSDNKAYAGVEGAPIGVAKPGTNVASGGTVDIIVQGVVPMIAEATIAVGVPVRPGAGGALNCVMPLAAGSAHSYPVLSSAGSEGVVFVLIK